VSDQRVSSHPSAIPSRRAVHHGTMCLKICAVQNSASPPLIGKGEDLVDPILERDQVPCDEFTAGSVEFMTMPDLEDFPQALVRIEADALGI
jgi:hypothetical protein